METPVKAALVLPLGALFYILNLYGAAVLNR
jgi:hypothetical protein